MPCKASVSKLADCWRGIGCQANKSLQASWCLHLSGVTHRHLSYPPVTSASICKYYFGYLCFRRFKEVKSELSPALYLSVRTKSPSFITGTFLTMVSLPNSSLKCWAKRNTQMTKTCQKKEKLSADVFSCVYLKKQTKTKPKNHKTENRTEISKRGCSALWRKGNE